MEDYNYYLPDERIAKHPVSPRDSSKLLLFKEGKISSSKFLNLVDHLPESAHLVFNNTKVIPARLYFQKKTGAKIEIFLLEPISPSNIISQVMETEDKVVWKCIVGNKKKWKDEILELKIPFYNSDFTLYARIENREENIISFTWEPQISFAEIVKAIGEIPLPPYLNRKAENEDSVNYQTVYSKFDGAVAAPTAGLHFTKKVFEQLSNANVHSSFITLHVGAGTFQPVKTENAMEHHMHSEQMVFSKAFIEGLLENNDYIIPVGTTSMRSLESLYWYGVKIINSTSTNVPFKIETFDPFNERNIKQVTKKEAILALLEYMELNNLDQLTGDTEIFIFPGYKLRMCNGIITNFHQPKSTLLLLISALTGDKWKGIYSYAMDNNYRFLSYGDSSLLLP
jgi:S-adenosylmethionine:tRNA ribosyltransferase-isomerase